MEESFFYLSTAFSHSHRIKRFKGAVRTNVHSVQFTSDEAYHPGHVQGLKFTSFIFTLELPG